MIDAVTLGAGHDGWEPRSQAQHDRVRTLVERIVDFIDENYADDISLRNVAETFGYSPCHLTHTFARSTGTPITAWIIKRRIVAAKRLLGEANFDVATTCEAVGFNDLCYFTRQFVRYVGLTPGRFRSAMNDPHCAREECLGRLG